MSNEQKTEDRGQTATVINGKPVVDTLSQRPCNVILRKAMNACANAFLPDRSELQERAEDADSVETMRELLAEFIADMTEYGAMAGAHQLRKAAHAKEDDQVNAVMAAYKLIGAPGDFGYETPRGKTWYAVLRAYDAVLKERMAVLDAEAASSDQDRHEVCQAVRADMDREDKEKAAGTYVAECQKVINRLLEGLELIAEMPVVDPALNIPVVSVVLQYDEARETARLTLDQYARNGGIVADRAALDDDEYPTVTLDLRWFRDDDGKTIRWADITDYDACLVTDDHAPRNYIMRLSDGEPKGEMLDPKNDWPAFRKFIKDLAFNDLREVGFAVAEGEVTHG